jgi:hypothetical protein
MNGSRFSEEQIIGILKEHEAGASTSEVCRRLGISDATLWPALGRAEARDGAVRLKFVFPADHPQFAGI